MHFNYAFVITYFINVFLLVNNINAFNLSYGHRKRELSFNNAGANPTDNTNNPQSQLNDPGYTRQHENEDLKKLLNDKNINLTNAQNWLELFNPSGQMFHVIYMLPNPQKRELNGMQLHEGNTRQQLKGADENLAYAGPHLFPTQFDESNQQNIQQLNPSFKNFNNAFQNTYTNPLLAPQYYQNLIKDSKVGTKMEAPFIPSQFLGYDQSQKQQLTQQQQQPQFAQQGQPLPQQVPQIAQQRQQLHPQNQLLAQQSQQLSHQNQLLPHQNQLLPQLNPMFLPHQEQQLMKTVPVHEHREDMPFQSSNLIYMSPNNIYNLYRKPN